MISFGIESTFLGARVPLIMKIRRPIIKMPSTQTATIATGLMAYLNKRNLVKSNKSDNKLTIRIINLFSYFKGFDYED